jgi:hypothetical protein
MPTFLSALLDTMRQVVRPSNAVFFYTFLLSTMNIFRVLPNPMICFLHIFLW